MKNLFDKIESKYRKFSSSQKKIAEYLFHNLSEAIVLSSSQIANKLDVSDATISRFIITLGYSGFAEFKREAGRQLFGEYYTTKKLTESANTFEGSNTVLKDILQADIENLKKLEANIPDNLFCNAVNKLSKARSIYVLGLRSSHSLAIYLAFNLRFFHTSIKIIQPGIEDLPEQIVNAGENDILIAFSFKRYTRRTISIVEKFKKKGTYIIGITGTPLSPLGQLADIILIANIEIPTYIHSYTAVVCLINALITAIAIRNKKNTLTGLNRLEKEFKEFDIFVE